MMHIEILGIPVPLARHRHFKMGSIVSTYDPQSKKKVEFQKKIKVKLLKVDIVELLKKETVELTLTFGMPYPKSKVRKNMPCISTISHITKPDLDNLIKFVCDCGNGLLWSDDKKIIKINAKKNYMIEPKTIISIS